MKKNTENVSSRPALFISTSREFRDVVGPTAQYRSTNFKYLPNSTLSCTQTQRKLGWNFPTWVDAMLQLTGHSAYFFRGKSRQVSQFAQCKFRETHHQGLNCCLLTGCPNYRSPSLRCTSGLTLASRGGCRQIHVCADHEGTRPQTHCTCSQLAPQTFVLVPSPQINPHAKSTRMRTVNRKIYFVNLHAKSTRTLTRNRKLT